MVVQKPLLLELDNALVGSPSLNFLQEGALPVEWTFRVVSDSDFDGMGSTGRILEEVVLSNLIDGGTLEETAIAVGLHDFAILVVDGQLLDLAIKAKHVIRQLNVARTEGWTRSGCVWAKGGLILIWSAIILITFDNLRSLTKTLLLS